MLASNRQYPTKIRLMRMDMFITFDIFVGKGESMDQDASLNW